MILVQLYGGIGNQMFQYALGRHLAAKLNVELKYFFENPKGAEKRELELTNFQIKAQEATNLEVFRIKGFKNYLFDTLQINNLLLGRRAVIESKMAFNPTVLNVHDNTFLKGYWQSEKYFLPIRELLLHEFQLETGISPESERAEKQLKKSNSVAVHIRRGDYLTSKNAQTYINLSTEYYEQAANRMLQKHTDCKFYVFTDDEAWVETQFKPFFEFEIVKTTKNPAIDLHLMSRCKHQITANSSFSWWAAWLNQNENKTVISPAKWFKTTKFETDDRMPETWIKI